MISARSFASVRAILDPHSPQQVKAVPFNEGERYGRFSHAKFVDLIEHLQLLRILSKGALRVPSPLKPLVCIK